MRAALLLLVVSVGFVLAGCAPDDPVTVLTREFDGAYPAAVDETGEVREYTLEAAPAVPMRVQ